MQFLNNEYIIDNDCELTLETPIGWSSACLESTTSYYVNCNYTDLQLNEEKVKNSKDN